MTVYYDKLYVQIVECCSTPGELENFWEKLEKELALRISCHDPNPNRSQRMYTGYDNTINFLDLCKGVERIMAKYDVHAVKVFIKNTFGNSKLFILGDEHILAD